LISQDKVFENLCQLVLILFTERETQWKDGNDFLKYQISQLRQELADFRNDVFDEVKRHQLPTDFAKPDSFKGRKSMLLISVRDSQMTQKLTQNRNAKGAWTMEALKNFFLRVCFLLFRSSYYILSAYLDLTRKNPSRKSLVKLRISSYTFRIETGRYRKIPCDERLCSLCNCNNIEDETHFLTRLPELFFDKRQVLF